MALRQQQLRGAQVAAWLAVVLVACNGNDSDSIAGTSSTDSVDRSLATALPSAAAADSDSTGSATNMSVDGPLHPGDMFTVEFTGELRKLRGGYLWVQTLDGSNIALLRGDGNSEIAMASTMDPDEFEMLDDGITGETSNYLLPAALEPDSYQLCTANSRPDVCIEIEVRTD